MNRHESTLKQIIHEAGLDAGVRPPKTREAVEAVMESLNDTDGPHEVAAKALFAMCVDDDGSFSGFVAGLKAVLRFLAETIPEQNQPDGDDAILALGPVLKTGCTLAKLRRWVREWYGS